MVRDAYKYRMIERLVLRNWKSHHRTFVEFEPGTNVIIGINGAGKSSVLEAIYFALFGPPEKNKFYERTLRNGEKEGYVELTFTHGGKRYTVKRWFDRKQQKDARIEGDEKVITSRPRDVDEKIVEILGMDGKTFRDAVYARQNEMASILNDSRRRKELIDEMIEISEFSRLRDSILALRNRLKSWLSGIAAANTEERLKRQEEKLKKKRQEMEQILRQRKELTEKIAALEGQLTTARGELEEIEGEYKTLREKRAMLEEEKGRRRSLIERVEQLRRDVGAKIEVSEELLQNLRKELEEVRQLEKKLAELHARRKDVEREINVKSQVVSSITVDVNVENELKKAEDERERLEEEYRKTSEQIATIRSEIKSMEEKIRELTERHDNARKREEELKKIREKYGDVQKLLEKKQKEIQELLRNISSIENEIRREEEFVVALKGAEKCPVCGSELGKERAEELRLEHEKRLEELRKRLPMLRKKVDEERRVVKELETVARRAMTLAEGTESSEELAKEIKKVEESKKQRGFELRTLEKRVEKIREALEAVQKEIRQMREKLDAAKRRKVAEEEIQRLRAKLEQIEEDIRATEKELNGRVSEEIDAKVRRLEKGLELKKLEETVKTIDNEIKALEEEVARLRSVEKEREKKIEEISKLQAMINAEKTRLADLERLTKMLEREIGELEKDIAESRRVLEETERKRKMYDMLNRMLPAVETARERVREARIRAINKALNIVWRGLYPRRDITEIRLRPEANDYILEVKRDGQWVPVQNLSGGEFYDAALALRIAISALKAKELGLLILDEPTHNLDADATEALAHLLNQLPEYGLFRQIIVITHDETLQKAATGTVYLFERDKDHNRPTEVKKLTITHEI